MDLHRKRNLYIGLCVAVVILGAALGTMFRSAPQDEPVAWWNWTVEPISGTIQDPMELKDEWLVLNFWASWCEPCRLEMPLLQSMKEHLGLPILGLGMDEDLNIAQAVTDELGVDYPTWRVEPIVGLELIERYGGSGALPYTVLVDSDQNLIASHTGLLDSALLQQWNNLIRENN